MPVIVLCKKLQRFSFAAAIKSARVSNQDEMDRLQREIDRLLSESTNLNEKHKEFEQENLAL